MIYAAYGSNLNKAQFKERCPDSRIIGKGYLAGYKLRFRGNRGFSYLNVEKTYSFNNRVPVVLYNISEKDEEALDLYEGYPEFYKKEKVTVYQKDHLTEAVIYVMNDGYNLNLPSKFYLKTCLEGYREYRFNPFKILCALIKSIWKGRASVFFSSKISWI